MQMATVFAYAFRSAIAHGHWSAIPERRAHALACEEWLWTLAERALEQRLLGTRLPSTAVVLLSHCLEPRYAERLFADQTC